MDVTRTPLTLIITGSILLFLGIFVFDFGSWPLWVVMFIGGAAGALAAWVLHHIEIAAGVAARERAARRAMNTAAHAERLRKAGAE